MSLASSIKKQPDETLKITIDFTNLLASGDTLTGSPTVTSTIFGSSSSSDLTISGVARNSANTGVELTVSGGTDGNAYVIRAICSTSNGETLEGEGLLVVRELLWQSHVLIILRTLINDLSTSPTYSDNRLLDIFLVAALQTKQEVTFSKTYTINITKGTISPDPSTDETFLNLVTLKAACIVDRGNLRSAALKSGLEAKCGPAVMRTLRHMEGFATLIDKGYCQAYDEARLQHEFGNLTWAKAVLSPFINANFFPEDHATDFVTFRIER